MSDILHIHILGDRKKGESYIGFARKKLVEIISLDRPQKEIQLENGVVIFLQHTPGTRQDIVITVPERDDRKKKREVVSDKEEAILFFYGPPKEQLALTNIKGLLAGGTARCGDGHGTVTNIAGNNLLGEFVKCWKPGDSVLVVSTGATAEIINCYAKVYHFTYTSYSLFSDFLFRDGWLTRSPADFITRMCRDNLNTEYRTHSKIYGNPNIGWMTLTAVESMPYAMYGLKIVEWVLCAKYNGRQVMFDGEQSSESFSRGFFGEIPLLFDLWEMSGTFYAGVVTPEKVIIWKHDKVNNNFVSTVEELRIYPILETAELTVLRPLGFVRGKVYSILVPKGSGSFIILHEDYVSPGNYYRLKEVHGAYKTCLWNHFNGTLYFAFERFPEEEEPPLPQHVAIPECCHITLHVVGKWYSCMWSCGGGLIDCSCWVCTDPEKVCFMPEGYTMACEHTVGNITYKWKMYVVHATRIGTSIDYFWHTFHRVMFVPVLHTDKGNDVYIQGYKQGEIISGAKFHGGGITRGNIAGYGTFRDGQHYNWGDSLSPCKKEDLNRTEYCVGEMYSYTFKKWVFTADDKGYFLEYNKNISRCDAVDVIPGRLGDKDYAPGASNWPHDHQWTAILMEGTEDIDGQPLTPTLVYVNGETDNNLFYGQSSRVTQIPEEGNRAFFQYASREYFKEMIYGSN